MGLFTERDDDNHVTHVVVHQMPWVKASNYKPNGERCLVARLMSNVDIYRYVVAHYDVDHGWLDVDGNRVEVNNDVDYVCVISRPDA